MSYIKFIEPVHSCQLPPIGDAGFGSVWECDVCKKKWILVNPNPDLDANVSYMNPIDIFHKAWTEYNDDR